MTNKELSKCYRLLFYLSREYPEISLNNTIILLSLALGKKQSCSDLAKYHLMKKISVHRFLSVALVHGLVSVEYDKNKKIYGASSRLLSLLDSF